MIWFIFGLLFFLFIFFLVSISKKQPVQSNKVLQADSFPYVKNTLMTDSEISFFRTLVNILENKYLVFPQVRLASLISVKKGINNWQKFFNKIFAKSVDFVIYDIYNKVPKLVIELDDSSHRDNKRNERDVFIDNALRKAGIEIIHVNLQNSYNIQELRKQIWGVLNFSNVK